MLLRLSNAVECTRVSKDVALVCNWFELSKVKIGKMHEENLTC